MIAGMANGLECVAIPRPEWWTSGKNCRAAKLRKGRGKYIFKLAFGDRLPELFERPKKGFEMPIAEWLWAT